MHQLHGHPKLNFTLKLNNSVTFNCAFVIVGVYSSSYSVIYLKLYFKIELYIYIPFKMSNSLDVMSM